MKGAVSMYNNRVARRWGTCRWFTEHWLPIRVPRDCTVATILFSPPCRWVWLSALSARTLTQHNSYIHRNDGVDMPKLPDSRRGPASARDAAEAAFKSPAPTKPAEPAKPVIVLPGVRELVSLRIDQDVLEHFRAMGRDWQDKINEALRRSIHEMSLQEVDPMPSPNKGMTAAKRAGMRYVDVATYRAT